MRLIQSAGGVAVAVALLATPASTARAAEEESGCSNWSTTCTYSCNATGDICDKWQSATQQAEPNENWTCGHDVSNGWHTLQYLNNHECTH